MIVEIKYRARCKHCRYCGYDNYIKKNGETGKRKIYWCLVQSNKRVSLKKEACYCFELSDINEPRSIEYALERVRKLKK